MSKSTELFHRLLKDGKSEEEANKIIAQQAVSVFSRLDAVNVFIDRLAGGNEVFEQLLEAGVEAPEASRLIGEAAAENLTRMARGESSIDVLENVLKAKSQVKDNQKLSEENVSGRK